MIEPLAVEFEAELRQIKSMVDHSFNVTINVPEYCLEQVQQMMGHLGSLLNIVAIFEEKQ